MCKQISKDPMDLRAGQHYQVTNELTCKWIVVKESGRFKKKMPEQQNKRKQETKQKCGSREMHGFLKRSFKWSILAGCRVWFWGSNQKTKIKKNGRLRHSRTELLLA